MKQTKLDQNRPNWLKRPYQEDGLWCCPFCSFTSLFRHTTQRHFQIYHQQIKQKGVIL